MQRARRVCVCEREMISFGRQRNGKPPAQVWKEIAMINGFSGESCIVYNRKDESLQNHKSKRAGREFG